MIGGKLERNSDMKKLVTALVPTLGEKTIEDSINSLKKQTHELTDIIIVRDVTPFPEAMNRGVKQVKTPFLVQCDADMILLPDCVETLLAAMDENTGLSIGYLHDDLLGDIQAVKLYRTECLRKEPFQDSIATDTDGIKEIVRHGFRIAFATRTQHQSEHPPDVLGFHRPDYSDSLYVYGKFSLMGSIVRSRNSYREYSGVLGALKHSQHPMADLAITAFCHGLFNDIRKSGHRPFDETPDYQFVDGFLSGAESTHNLFAITRLADYDRSEDLASLHIHLDS